MSGYTMIRCLARGEHYKILPDVILKMGGHAFKIVGYHQILDIGWHCLENIGNGERRDIQLTVLNRLFDEGVVEALNAMEALAYAARGKSAPKS